MGYRILSIGNFNTGWDGSQCDEEHIAKALEELGHEVVRCQREEFAYPTQGFDFTLVAQWNNYDPEVYAKLPKPLVYWAFDYQEDGQEWHERLVKESDLYLSKRIADSKYPNWRWLPQDFAPSFLDPVYDWQTVEFSTKPEKEYDVVFTGSHLPWARHRIEILKAVDKEFDLHVFSVTPDQWRAEGLKNVHGPIMDHGLPELYGKAKINLSIDHTIEAGYWSDRNSQIICCGGFVLFKYVPMSEQTFGEDVVYFYTIEDCLEKIRFYLNNEQERENIAQRAQESANKYRKVDYRVKQLLTIVKEIL